MTFGEKIQKLRKEAAMSQEELAYQLDVSRQAVSKWERDNGYPETEKIVRMSKLFNVSLDYLLNEEDSEKPEIGPEERGLYVSRETANGFLAYHKRKMMKVGAAVGLFIGSLSLAFWDAEINMIIFMAVVILALILLISVRLADDPYSRLWKESLVFDKAVKSELATAYADRKKSLHILNLVGAALIATGFLLCPIIVPAEIYALDSFMLALGMVLAGAGAFLCVYISGVVRAYRLLIMNEKYHEKRR